MFSQRALPSQRDNPKEGLLSNLPTSCIARLVALAAIGTGGIGVSQFADLPAPFTKGAENNRTVNGLSTVVAGIIGQKINENSDINLTVKKPYFADAHVHGTTRKGEIDTQIDLAFTTSHFQATKAGSYFNGSVDKSEFNWEVEQTSANDWQIARFGPKFDSTLHITVDNGEIHGVLERPLAYDWVFNGTYDKSGIVKMEFNRPWLLDFELQGKIVEAR